VKTDKRLKRLFASVIGGSWGTEPGEGEIDALCIRGTDFDATRLRVDTSRAPTRGFTIDDIRARAAITGDLIIEKSGGGEQQPVGRAVLWDGTERVMPTNFAARLRVNVETDSRFATYLLASMWSDGRTRAAIKQTTGIQNLDLTALLDQRVSCPSLPRQRAVADYLDRETARIDALIAAKRRMVRLLEERWETFGIASVTSINAWSEHARSGPDWLESVPREWSVERLKFLARMESGHTPDRKVDAYWVDCTIPWITLNDVGTLQRDWAIDQSINAINDLGMANSAAHILPAGTVVLSRDATVGRAAILGRPMTISQHFVGWICGPRLMPEYLLHVLRGPMQRLFATLTAGATIATIGMPELNDLVVPVPPVDEQRRIVATLRSAQDRFDQARTALDMQVGLLLERRQALVIAAVTGRLDIPEAA